MVCLSCAGVYHNFLEEYEHKVIQYVIYTSGYKVEDYKYGVTCDTMKMVKSALIIQLNMQIVRQNTKLPYLNVRLG